MPQTITTNSGALPGPRPRRSSSHLHTPFQSSSRSAPWVWKSIIILFIINVFLLTLGAYGWSRLRHLSLPFSTILPAITTFLPIINFLSLSHGIVLSRGQLQKLQTFRTYLYILIFLILDTIITVVSFTHLANYGNVATCTLGEQWQGFWSGKEEGKVKRIQDSLGCCGFRTVKDRAWPWGKGVDTGECRRLTGRDTPCVGVWRGEEKMVAGLFVGVGVVLGVVKFISLLIINKEALFGGEESSSPYNTSGTSAAGGHEDGVNHHTHHRRLIEEIPSEGEDDQENHNGRKQGRGRIEQANGVDGREASERTRLLDGDERPGAVNGGEEGNVWIQ